MSTAKHTLVPVDEESIINLALDAQNEISRAHLDLFLHQANELARYQQQIPPGMFVIPGTGPNWSALQERVSATYESPAKILEVCNKACLIRNSVIVRGILEQYVTTQTKRYSIRKMYKIVDDEGQPLLYPVSARWTRKQIFDKITVKSDIWHEPNLVGVHVLIPTQSTMLIIRPTKTQMGHVIGLEGAISEPSPENS